MRHALASKTSIPAPLLAIAKGKGYMGFGIAMARFKKALIPLLMNLPPEPGRMRSIFEDVFR